MSLHLAVAEKLLKNAKAAPMAMTFTYEQSYSMEDQRPTLLKIKEDNKFTPLEVTPGNNAKASVTFINPRDWFREKNIFISFKIENTTGQTLTIFNILDLIEQFHYRVNEVGDWIRYQRPEEVKCIISENLKAKGKDLANYLSTFRSELTTFNGDSILSSGEDYFMVPFFLFADFMQDMSPFGGVQKLEIEIRFRSAPTDANAAAQFIKSGSTSTAYTKAGIRFSDLSIVEQQQIVQDSRLQQSPSLFRIPLRFSTIELAFDGTASGAKTRAIKLSEIRSTNNIQYITFWFVPDRTAYNATDAGKIYSGYQYFSFRIHLVGDASTYDLDFTNPVNNPHRLQHLRNYEIEGQRMRYNDYLGLADHSQSIDTSKYFIAQSMIHMNYEWQDAGRTHELINRVDASRRDYEFYIQNEQILPGNTGKLIVGVAYYENTDLFGVPSK